MSYLIQYTGFESQPRGRDYSYQVVGPKSEARRFILTITNRAFEDRRAFYQDGAAICYQKLERELLTETSESPLSRHFTISDQELATYADEHRPVRKRSW